MDSKKRKLNIEKLENTTKMENNNDIHLDPSSHQPAIPFIQPCTMMQEEDSLIFPSSQAPSSSNQVPLTCTQPTLLDPPLAMLSTIRSTVPSQPSQSSANSSPVASIQVIEVDVEGSPSMSAATPKHISLPLKKGQWSCPGCTYFNDKLQSRCVMCDSENPAMVATRRSSRGSSASLRQQRISSFV